MKNKILSFLVVIFALCTCMVSLVACEENPHAHTHNYSILKFDDESHWFECECEEKNNVTLHNIKNGECACGYVVPHTHNYATLKYDNENHWFECECEEKNNITLHNIKNDECACGYIVTHSHEYTTLKTDESEHWYECVCGDKSGIEAHKGGAATCTTLAVCSVCSESYGEFREHNHTALENNETQHWYECVCGDKDSIENHKGGTATYTELAVCSICNVSYGNLKVPSTQMKTYYDGFFDTLSIIYSYRDDSTEEFTKNHTDVAELLRTYQKLFDIYCEYAGMNNIRTINRNAGKSPVKVDPLLIDFLLYAKEIYTLTNGKTNIAMGSVFALWRKCREDASIDPYNARIPDATELAEAALHCDINNLIIDVEACTVYIDDPDMRLDVGDLGKGYATEKAAQLLIARGVTSYVLDIGGNIRVIGEKVTGDAWTAGITNPDRASSESLACKVSIKNTSLVTLGDYESFYYVGDQKYHHVIDPVTLMPTNYFPSVSIITADNGLATALATALCSMSHEDGLALVESIVGVDAIWICHDGTIKHTDGIQFTTL